MSYLMRIKKKLKSYNKIKKPSHFLLLKPFVVNVDVQKLIMNKDKPDQQIKRQHYFSLVWIVETNGIKIDTQKQNFHLDALQQQILNKDVKIKQIHLNFCISFFFVAIFYHFIMPKFNNNGQILNINLYNCATILYMIEAQLPIEYQHYFHQQFPYRSKRANITPFRIAKNKQICQFVCVSNANAIEIYRVSPHSIDFYQRKQFFCNIRKLEVIPSNHHSSDYIFILDEIGRFSIWRPEQGEIITCNTIQKQSTNKRYYNEQTSPQQEEQFCGKNITFNVKDTLCTLFFTVRSKLIILDIVVKKNGLALNSNNTRTFQIPYSKFRFVNLLSSKKDDILIGIIEEVQQKTFLRVHKITKNTNFLDHQSLDWTLDKTNLISFSSSGINQVLVLTYNEITLYKYQSSHHICNYRTRGNYGNFCSIDEEIFIHLGFQITLFTKTKIFNYGTLKYNGKNILDGCRIEESKYVCHTSDGGVVLGLATDLSEMYFLILYETSWKMIRNFKSLACIFSIQQIDQQQNHDSMAVVYSSGLEMTEVSVVQIISPTILNNQQTSPKVIQSISLMNQGKGIILCTRQDNQILKWVQAENQFIPIFKLPNQQIINSTQQFIIMTSGIYTFNLDTCQLINIAKEENILSVTYNKSYIGYYTSEGLYKFFQIQNQSVSRIRKDCLQQYQWHMIKQDVLISTSYNELGQIRFVPIHKQMKKINLKSDELISSISSIHYGTVNKLKNKMIDENQENIFSDVVIGFYNGAIQIYSLQKNCTLTKFQNIGTNLVKTVTYRDRNLLLSSGNRQFILSCQRKTNENNYSLHQIDLTSQENIESSINYLQFQDKFLICNTYLSESSSKSSISSTFSTFQLKSLKFSKTLSDTSLSLQLKSSIQINPIFSHSQIPFSVVLGDYIYIAINESFLKYSLKTKQLVRKQLHILKQIIAIDKIASGILVLGIDLLDNGSVVLFGNEDIQIISQLSMGKTTPQAIKGLKEGNGDKFLLRYQQTISLYQLDQTKQLVPICGTNINVSGFSMDVHESFYKILLLDPFRYLVVYDFENNKFLPVSKHIGSFTINDCAFIQSSVVYGDRGGRINVLQFNFGAHDDVIKTNMTNVGSLYVGEEIITIRRVIQKEGRSNQVYYGCSSGTIGRLKTISAEDFKILKKIELDVIEFIDKKEKFSYQQWRLRVPQNDKIIDQVLIKYYLQEFRCKVQVNTQDFYNQVKRMYQKCLKKDI